MAGISGGAVTYDTALGFNAIATGGFSLASGYNAMATGANSYAAGSYSTASGKDRHRHGGWYDLDGDGTTANVDGYDEITQATQPGATAVGAAALATEGNCQQPPARAPRRAGKLQFSLRR